MDEIRQFSRKRKSYFNSGVRSQQKSRSDIKNCINVLNHNLRFKGNFNYLKLYILIIIIIKILI